MPRPGPRLHALHADADVRGRGAPRDGRRDGPGGRDGGGVLLGVRAWSVAVLEVDTEVLDGFALQLGAHPVVDGAGQVLGEPEDPGQRPGVGGVFVQRGQGAVAPGAYGAGGEGVGGYVDGVHGLAGAGVAGVAAGEFGVDPGEGGTDPRADRVRERCPGHATLQGFNKTLIES